MSVKIVELRAGETMVLSGGAVVTVQHKAGRAVRLRVEAPDTTEISSINLPRPPSAEALTEIAPK